MGWWYYKKNMRFFLTDVTETRQLRQTVSWDNSFRLIEVSSFLISINSTAWCFFLLSEWCFFNVFKHWVILLTACHYSFVISQTYFDSLTNHDQPLLWTDSWPGTANDVSVSQMFVNVSLFISHGLPNSQYLIHSYKLSKCNFTKP